MRGIKRFKTENGLASIVVVGLLVVLLTLITVGFARIMGRSVQNSTSNETAASASYAAQSGLNDLATYLRTNPDVYATRCNDLIVDSAGNKGPFYNDANVSGDKNTRYTCLLVNQRPTDLVYQNITNLKSKVVKLNTDIITSSISSFMFSWQARDQSKNALPAPATNIMDETTWNNNNYVPVLRISLYPILTGGAMDDNVQSNSRTWYLTPANSGGAASKTYDYLSTADGSRLKVQCDTSAVPGFNGTADYQCNAVISGLEKVTNIDYYYVRLTPIYNNVDIKIKANDIDNRVVKFKNVQAVLDVTAKAGPAAKRLQSRVDIAGIDTSTGSITESPDLSPDQNSAPDFSLRSANGICKRYKITNDVYDYSGIDGACPNPASPPIKTPAPTLAMNVNGVDSQTATPGGAYYGTDYISSGGSAQINWNTTDATSCIASSSTGSWSGEKKGIMSFTPTGVGTGTQTFGGLNNVQNYTLTCSGPGSGVSPGVSKTVTAWPPPVVSFNNTTVRAGNNYSLSWNVRNSISCTANGAWSGGKSSSVSQATFSESQGTWPWNDNSTKTFVLTCRDPQGRAQTATITLGPGRPPTCTAGDPSCGGPVDPPSCHADPITWRDNGNGTGTMSWNGTCPDVSPGSGYYQLINCSGAVPCGWVGNASTATIGVGTYCNELISGADPWGWLADGGRSCITIGYPQVRIDYFEALAWDQGPAECDSSTGYYNQWLCRNDPTKVNPANGSTCADGVHRYTACGGDVYWYSHLDGGSTSGISCSARSNVGGLGGSGGGYYSAGPYGWNGVPYPFYVQCSGPTPGPGGGGNSVTACWNGGDCGRTYP